MHDAALRCPNSSSRSKCAIAKRRLLSQRTLSNKCSTQQILLRVVRPRRLPLPRSVVDIDRLSRKAPQACSLASPPCNGRYRPLLPCLLCAVFLSASIVKSLLGSASPIPAIPRKSSPTRDALRGIPGTSTDQRLAAALALRSPR